MHSRVSKVDLQAPWRADKFILTLARLHSTKRIYHLHLDPLFKSTALARSFWFVHIAKDSSRMLSFNHVAARRKRMMKPDLLSKRKGSAASSRCHRTFHWPSMAFRSGECFGCISTKQHPARRIALRVRSFRRHLS